MQIMSLNEKEVKLFKKKKAAADKPEKRHLSEF